MSYTRQSVTMASILITIFIFSILYIANQFFQNILFQVNSFQSSNQTMNSIHQSPENKNQSKKETTKSNTNETKNQIQNQSTNQSTKQNATKNATVTNKVTKTAQMVENEWKIIIPSIGLEAIIAEGTSSEVMNRYVGHFENTSIWNGNVALAAHNRGYPVNYFANVKKMKKGDIIEYDWNGQTRRYQVETITKIRDTDWTYLENTKDNRITLITCVENEPEYRRCVQAVEI